MATFGAAEVIQIASKLSEDDETFVVGGQATNLWAWYYYSKNPELLAARSLTSKDIDYFGPVRAAESLATALGGTVAIPTMDDATPNTALVQAVYNGKPLQIDFLKSLLGITNRDLKEGTSIIHVEAEVDGEVHTAEVRVLHPFYCLKSRVANILHPATLRRDALAMLQLEASIAILQAHIDEAIGDQDTREANLCLRGLGHYLRHDPFGKHFHEQIEPFDALPILLQFRHDLRLDVRYRERMLENMIRRVEEFRVRRVRKIVP